MAAWGFNTFAHPGSTSTAGLHRNPFLQSLDDAGYRIRTENETLNCSSTTKEYVGSIMRDKANPLANEESNSNLDLILRAVSNLTASIYNQRSEINDQRLEIEDMKSTIANLRGQLQHPEPVETNVGDGHPIGQETDIGGELPRKAGWLTVDEVKGTNDSPGAVFNFLYRRLKSPKLTYEAFTDGLYGFPPILDMEARGNEFEKRWRAGKYKKFYEIKVVYNDIIAQPVTNRNTYMLGMSVKFSKKTRAAMSTLSRDIQKARKSAKMKLETDHLEEEEEMEIG